MIELVSVPLRSPEARENDAAENDTLTLSAALRAPASRTYKIPTELEIEPETTV